MTQGGIDITETSSVETTSTNNERARTMNGPDETAATELHLCLVNDGGMYGQRTLPTILMLEKKWRSGVFVFERGVDGAMPLFTEAAKKYHDEHGTPGDRWQDMFTVPTRRLAASEWVADLVDEWELGNFHGDSDGTNNNNGGK